VAAFSILAFMPMSVYDLCYAITLIGETLLLMVTRMVDRLKKADDLQGIEPSIFDKPKVGYVWYFVVMYIFGILFNSKMLCDVAFFAAIAYMLAAYVYEYLLGTKDYLYINNRTRGIPRKRLYGISTAMVLLFLMLAFICILPSVFLSGYRRYTDVRHWFDDAPPVEYEYEGDGGFNPTVQQENPIMAFDPEGGEINEPSKLVNTVFWVIGAACFIGIIYGIIQTIRQIFKDFRNTLDENGDIIEEIKDDEAPYSEDELHIRGSHIDSEAMRIRRRYKKTIKKHRRDLPKPYESPNEIEENAGLGGDEEMKVLHGQYENARYGRWS
jgi:phosphatidylglycerophosphate synthase